MGYNLNIRSGAAWVNLLKDAHVEITDSNAYFTSSTLDGVLDELYEAVPSGGSGLSYYTELDDSVHLDNQTDQKWYAWASAAPSGAPVAGDLVETEAEQLVSPSNNGGGYTNHTLRSAWDLSDLGYEGETTKIKVFVPAKVGSVSWAWTKLYVGKKEPATNVDFDGNQVEILQGGTSGGSSGTTGWWSDWVDVTLQDTDELVVSFHTTAGSPPYRAKPSYISYTGQATGDIAAQDDGSSISNGASMFGCIGISLYGVESNANAATNCTMLTATDSDQPVQLVFGTEDGNLWIRRYSGSEWPLFQRFVRFSDIDTVPTSGSSNPISSDWAYDYINTITITDHSSAGTSLELDGDIKTHVFICDQSTLTLTDTNFDDGDEIYLIMTDGGGCTITWPTGTEWPGSTEPTWTTSGTDRVILQRITSSIIHARSDGLNYG